MLIGIFVYFGRESVSIDFFQMHCPWTYRYGAHYSTHGITPAQNHFSSLIIFCETHYKTVSVSLNVNLFASKFMDASVHEW